LYNFIISCKIIKILLQTKYPDLLKKSWLFFYYVEIDLTFCVNVLYHVQHVEANPDLQVLLFCGNMLKRKYARKIDKMNFNS